MQQKNLVEEPLGCYYCYPEVTNHAQEKLNSVLIAYLNRPFSFVINLLTLYNLEMKRAAIEKVSTAPTPKIPSWKENKSLLQWLQSL